MGRKRKKASQVRAIFANASEKTKKKLAGELRSGKVKVIGRKNSKKKV